jgi:ABC-type multidrug transport system fused ATPase/permease subunit
LKKLISGKGGLFCPAVFKKMDWQKNKIYLIYKLFRRGFRGFRWQVFTLAFLGVLGGLFEGIGINAVIPLFSFLMGGSSFGDNFISKATRQFFALIHLRFSFRYLLIFVCVLFIFRAVTLFVCNYLRVVIAARYEKDTRDRLFSKTLMANWPFLLKQKLGHLDTMLALNISYNSLLLQYLSGAVMTAGGLLMYVLVALNISFNITLLTLALGAILIFGFYPLVRKTKVIAQEKEKMNKSVAHYINENILGMKTVKSMRLSEPVADIGRNYFSQLKDLVLRVSFLKIFSDSLIQPIGLIFITVIFAIAYKTPGFNIAILGAVIYLIQRIFTYVQQLQSYLHTVSESIPYLQATIEYEDLVNKNKEVNGATGNFEFNDRLEFREVSFNHEGGEPVLKKINFKIKKGETVGLIGPSGAGKTTIVDLVLRLFSPTGGEILADGKNISGIDLAQWRQNIGYIAQDIYLKNDTIAENIRFYDESIKDDQVAEAAKMANLSDFIEQCPEGLETVVGERGVRLSAGQRQRIIIARILARQPKIMILDEATSALDNESENQIQKVIDSLKNKVTVLVIAHRLATLINSDRILVIDDGHINEDGAPSELLKNRDTYFYKVYNMK